MAIHVRHDCEIPESELSFSFSTSSKPGGQNVNKVSTRATLEFDVARSRCLTERQRELILNRLATRINKHGILRVASQKYRSQGANREAAVARFAELLNDALTVKPPRMKPRVPHALKEQRLRDKKHHGRLKKDRSRIHHPED